MNVSILFKQIGHVPLKTLNLINVSISFKQIRHVPFKNLEPVMTPNQIISCSMY
jgi:hypothetical protein